MKLFSLAVPKGLWCILLANLFFSLMAVLVYAVKILDPSVSPFVVSFVRVSVNLLIILMPALAVGKGKQLWGDKSLSLWLRGFFGGIALMLFFYSIQALGPSESTFVQSSLCGMFIVLLCPLVLAECFSPCAFFAVLGSVVGLYILFDPTFSDGKTLGQVVAMVSGLFAAFAALMVAKAGKSNAPATIVFYFCFVAFFAHVVYFFITGMFVVPRGFVVWIAMIGTGIFSSGAQILTAKAYQIAPAPIVAALGYSAPVLNTIWGIVFFGQLLTGRALFGCSVILICGIFLPFLKKKTKPLCCIDTKDVL